MIHSVRNNGTIEFYGTEDECMAYVIEETNGTSESLIDEDYTTLIDGGGVHGYQISEEEEEPEVDEEYANDDNAYESALAVSYERKYGQ
jgi:hypothetical protein